MRLTGGADLLRRHVQGAALTVLAVGEVEVGAVATSRIAMAGAGRDAAAAGGLGEATLNHGLGSLHEASEECFFPTHLKTVG